MADESNIGGQNALLENTQVPENEPKKNNENLQDFIMTEYNRQMVRCIYFEIIDIGYGSGIRDKQSAKPTRPLRRFGLSPCRLSLTLIFIKVSDQPVPKFYPFYICDKL